MKTRTENSIKNLFFAIGGQILGILISLVARVVFIRILSTEYLGLSGLFTNILTILSLSELGFVTAMSYQLYKPISEQNKENIKTLMHFYKKIYYLIAFVILILGIITLPFYQFLMDKVPNIQHLNLIYLLFVLNTSVSYLFSHKRILIICDQKKYIATIYRYIFYFLLNVCQIIVLLITKNYILFLIVQIIMTLTENIALNIKANKMYPYLKERNIKKLHEKDYQQIIKNVKSMFYHKFGGVVLNSTDNIVISKILGLTSVGLYSNYMLIITALKTIIMQVFSSVIASIGNLNVNANRKKMTEIFKKTFFADYFIHVITTICLICLMNPFIKIWLGTEFLVDNFSVYCIAINYYLFGMRRTCMSFREATGNYSKDKYSPIIEAVINIVSSIILARYIGLAGVILGTIISSIFTNFWWEPLVITKNSLSINLKNYFMMYFKYTFIGIIMSVIIVYISSFIPDNTILLFFSKAVSVFVLSVVLFMIIYRNNHYYKFYKRIIKRTLKKGYHWN